MIAELIQNKWIWIAASVIAVLVIHRLVFGKDKATQLLEREYADVVNSEKYKVKGQYD